MKSQLQLVKAALGGPQATTVEAQMVKVTDGRLWAYGGTFCLSTPIASSLECGFFPAAVMNFYSLPREGATFTEREGHLIMRHEGKEWKTKIVPAQQIPSLVALGVRNLVTEQLRYLDVLATLCRNNTVDFRQGAWLQNGMFFALQRTAVCFSTDGFQFDLPDMGLPSDTMNILSRIKSPMTAVVDDRVAIQFEFEDGTWLASRKLEGLTPPDFVTVFDGFNDSDRFLEIEFREDIVSEIMAAKYSSVDNDVTLDMIWSGTDGNLSFEAPQDNTGYFPDAYTGGCNFKIKGEALRTVLALQPPTLGLMRADARSMPSSLNGYGDGFAVAAALTR
jgi:hypothetical protein